MKQGTAVYWLLSSVLVYSIFPLIGTYADTQINPVLFIGLSHLFALIALSILSATLVLRGRIPNSRMLTPLFRSRGFLLLTFASGGINAASHATLFASFIYINSASATALYEIWPAAVVVFIGRLLPRHYSPVKIREWLFVAMAIAGAAMLIRSAAMSSVRVEKPSLNVVAGVSLALLSAILMALSSGLDVLLARRLDNIANPIIQPIISQNIVKVFSAICALTAYFLFFRSAPRTPLMSSKAIGIAAITGIFVIAFGAVAYHIGNILAESPAVNVLWYFTPVLSLIWLDISGLARITTGVAIGAILIISANLLLTMRADPQTAYAGTLIGICLSAFFCNYVRGTNDEHYYDMIIAVTGIFAILVAFMLQRVSERAQRVADAAIELMEAVRRSTILPSSGKRQILGHALEFIESRPSERSSWPLPLLQSGVDRDVDTLGRRLAAVCGRVVSFGETLALVMLGGIALLVTHLCRPSSFVGDLVPVVMTGVLVFLCVRVIDEGHEEQLNTVLAIYEDTTLVGQEEVRPGHRRTHLMSIVLLFGIFVAYLLLLFRKYGTPFQMQ